MTNTFRHIPCHNWAKIQGKYIKKDSKYLEQFLYTPYLAQLVVHHSFIRYILVYFVSIVFTDAVHIGLTHSKADPGLLLASWLFRPQGTQYFLKPQPDSNPATRLDGSAIITRVVRDVLDTQRNVWYRFEIKFLQNLNFTALFIFLQPIYSRRLASVNQIYPE